MEMLNSIMRKDIGGEDDDYQYDERPVGDLMMAKIRQNEMISDGYHPDSDYEDSSNSEIENSDKNLQDVENSQKLTKKAKKG